LIDVATGTIRENTEVLIVAGRIAEVGSHLKHPKGTQFLDGSGKFLIPGLWDMHVHVAGLSANPKWSRDVLLPLLIANGITGVRDMGGDLPSLRQWEKEMKEGTLLGPEIYPAGPMLDGFEDPNVLLARNPEEARARVRQVKAMGAGFVKILSGLDRDSYFAVASESKAVGMDYAGHVPPLITTAEASNAGQKSIEHILYGGFSIACSSNEEPLRQQMAAAMQSGALLQMARVEDAAATAYDARKAAELWKTLVKNGTWVVPTLVSTYSSSHLDELVQDDPAARYLPHSLTKSWTADAMKVSLQPEKLEWWRRELPRQQDLVRQMHAAGVHMLAGTDSLDPHNVPGSSLDKELELLVESGLTPLEALQAATQEPAKFMKRTDIGGIAAGKRADLVLLNGNPLEDIRSAARIEAVITRGRLVSRNELDQIFARLKESASAH
jgi:Amidohydrolase family